MTSPQPGALLVADSFRVRVRDGRAEVRGLDHHLTRFARHTDAASSGRLRGVGNFLDEARHRIAAHGDGFPRLEYRVDGSLELLLRPLPALHDTIALRTASGVALEHPERKGPNIARLAELNRTLGAEALLLDTDGLAIEGATTSLLWWRDGALCTSAAGPRVASVTEALVVEAARAAGIEVVRGCAAAAALAAHEVWAVNALHGIRRVRAIDEAAAPAPNGRRLAEFRAALDGTWQEVAPAWLAER